LQMSRDMYLKAAEMHIANGNLFHCAKLAVLHKHNRCNGNAAVISKELGDSEGAMKHMELAADLYAELGNGDTSAMAFSKATSFLETADPGNAIQVSGVHALSKIYNKALTMTQQTDRPRMAGDFLNRLIRLYLKLERYADAICATDSEIDKYIEVKVSYPFFCRSVLQKYSSLIAMHYSILSCRSFIIAKIV
uniref:TPR_REGION domain-containing protein n=1 Tax=Toxocara canis TaxID=6265 RepID=A0A183VGG2_TOXCA